VRIEPAALARNGETRSTPTHARPVRRLDLWQNGLDRPAITQLVHFHNRQRALPTHFVVVPWRATTVTH
jgi:hypothetical protein